MATAVVFGSNGARIYEGINPADYAGRADVLIDPVFPTRVPPHCWRLKNGMIEVVGSPSVIGITKKPFSAALRALLWYSLGVATALTVFLGVKLTNMDATHPTTTPRPASAAGKNSPY
jgi:hypothetical protein